MAEFRVLELFSGIGGMHFAFHYAAIPGSVVAAVDINTVANVVYAHNHSQTVLLNNNIQRLSVKQINKLGVNLVLMSPPCQPFTRVGNQQDVNDKRTDALKHLCWLLPQCESVEYVLMENVKGFETSRARDFYLEAMKLAGFYIREFILSPTQFGVPNTRNRYYCLARRNKNFNFDNNKIWDTMPLATGNVKQQLQKQEITLVLEHENTIPADMFLDEKVLRKRIWLMDIVTPTASNTMCFTKAYTHYSEGTGSIFTASSEQDVKETFAKAKELQEIDGIQQLELLKGLRLRYFTPKEVARLMSFPEIFSFPNETSTKQKYRLLGNSINVRVVGELIKLLCTNN